MIREKTILCKLNQLKISDRKIFESLSPSPMPGDCPTCGAKGSCNVHDSYIRDMISIHDGARTEQSISIIRVICSSCGKTHALLPDILIPYGSYSLRFVLHVLKAYLARAGTVAALCESFRIAISTLYRWLRIFREHANLMFPSMEQIAWATAPAVQSIEGLDSFPSLFFRKYRFSFLQDIKRQVAIPST